MGKPTVVTSYADFDRRFGGLWTGSMLGFSVRDFFANGGSTAVIVRLINGGAPSQIEVNTLTLEASASGTWGASLRARVDHATKDPGSSSLFNLFVRDGATGAVEEHRNVTIGVTDSPRDLAKVLQNESALVTVKTPGAGRPTASATPAGGEDPWGDNTPATNYPAGTQGDDGSALNTSAFEASGPGSKTGLYALEDADIVNLIVIPPYKSDGTVDTTVVGKAAAFGEAHRAMLLVDPLPTWSDAGTIAGTDLSATVGTKSRNAALFYPRLRQPNSLHDDQVESFAPSGAVAGVIARTDAQRGVWKAPAGQEATLVGVAELEHRLTDAEIGLLNPVAVNCLRSLPSAGRVVWGARTMDGADRLASEWKYIPVRRTALFIEESLYRGTQWVVFEPNDEPLWAQIRLNVGTFMNNLFRQGAFQGQTPREAYFVKCDKETTTQADIDLGIVNIHVGFAPLKPAEFVVIRLQQIAGQGAV
ncbi:phage tail sheath family protein [Kribbia dieselivorans]|uniref:phage tail sheath family protein n=1 Tax=Kribbia dieselivorans TaxID=331526 RepID=UPI001C3F332F|nr:phage tail sheath subtilisin-like domain-containing protein [Kribbia dieselivorans]